MEGGEDGGRFTLRSIGFCHVVVVKKKKKRALPALTDTFFPALLLVFAPGFVIHSRPLFWLAQARAS